MSSFSPANEAPAPATGAPAEPPAAVPAKKKHGLVRRVLGKTIKWGLFSLITLVLLITGIVIWILWFFPNGLVIDLAKSQAKGFGIALDIRTLDVRPLEGVTVTGITVDADTNVQAGAPPLVAIGKVDVRWSIRDAIVEKRVHIESIAIDDPQLTLHQQGTVWNAQRLLDTLMPPPLTPTPTPAPTPAPPAQPPEEMIAANVALLGSSLAMVPVSVDLDSFTVTGAGAKVITDLGTIPTVDGISVTVALHLSSGSGVVEVGLEPEPGITVALQPGNGPGFSGTIKAGTNLEFDLDEVDPSITFGADVTMADGVAVAAGLDLPLTLDAKGYGLVDILAGDVTMVAEKIDVGGFLDAVAKLDVDGLGVKGIHAEWSSGIHGKKLPGFVREQIVAASGATSVNPGLSLKGSIDGALQSADPAVIQATLAKGRLPLSLLVKSEGTTDDDLIAVSGISVGKLVHQAAIDVSPEQIAIDGDVQITRLRMEPLLDGKSFSLSLDNRLVVRADLDGFVLEHAKVDLPEGGIALAGKGSVQGLQAAIDAFNKATAKRLDTVPAALAAVTALRDIDLAGSFRLAAPKGKEIELASGAFLRGSIDAKGSLRRRKDPYGRLVANVVYEDFGARIAANSTSDSLVLAGMNAHLQMDRELILGGAIAKPVEGDVFTDEAIVFDPATRGYYDRLGSLRAETDNFRIARVVAGPLQISDLSAEVLYDGSAVHVNRGRMQLLGGEVVGRMIIRPTSEGLHIATAGDVVGVDMAPLLIERPVSNPNDTRVHMSSAASFFLSKEDPIGSLADMRMRLDVTAAGSKVLDTLLAWLDPEFKDPMFNWARGVNQKVVGLTRPQFSAIADHGMYDVTVGFPSLGLSKDVKRIPLKPLLNLRFTQEIVGGLAPPGEMLPLLAARGIDGNGQIVLPPPPEPDR